MRNVTVLIAIVALVGAGLTDATPAQNTPAKNKPVVACWTGLPSAGGVRKLKVAPGGCFFLRRGGDSYLDGVVMRSLNWKHWGAPKTRARGKACAAGCVKATATLSKLHFQRRCDERVYTKVRFDVKGFNAPNPDFRLSGC